MSAVLRLLRGLAGLGMLAWLFSGARSQPRAEPGLTPAVSGSPSAAAPGSVALPPAEDAAVGPDVRGLQVAVGAIGL